MHISPSLIAAAVLFAASTPVIAQDFPNPDRFEPRSGWGSYADRMEVRLGGMFYDTGFFTEPVYNGGVVNGEFLFKSPDFLSAIGAPRPYVGVDVAISDDPVHFIYAGLNWDYNVTHRFYLSASLGGAIHTDSDLVKGWGERSLGTRALFHVGLAVGYDITDDLTVQAYLDHFSNAGLGPVNDGAESAGMRIGYRF